jgi:recombination protein RecA
MASKAQELMKSVNSALGTTALKLASDPSHKVQFLPTGLLPVDILFAGGLARGRFYLLVGDYSTLKSLIGLEAIAETQKNGGVCALIDTERAFDPGWAASLGVNVDELIIWPPRDDPDAPVTGEMAIDTAEALTRAGVDLIVFDSIAATLPQTEQNRRLHDESQQMARLAALMSKAMRKLTAANSKTAYLWINQYRINVGVTFGNPNTITGGKAQLYFASMIIEAKKVGKITRDAKKFDGEKWKTVKEQIGQKYQLTATKSKLSKPFSDIFFDWDLTTGQIDMPSFVVAQCMDFGIVKVSGNTMSYKNWKAGSRKKFIQLVADTPALYDALDAAVRAEYGIPVPPRPRTAAVARNKPRRTAKGKPKMTRKLKR